MKMIYGMTWVFKKIINKMKYHKSIIKKKYNIGINGVIGNL